MRNFLNRVAAGPNQMVGARGGRPRAAVQGDRSPTAYTNRRAINRGTQGRGFGGGAAI